MSGAVDEIRDAKDIMSDSDGIINKVCVAVIVIVAVLLLITAILPDWMKNLVLG